MPPVVVRTPPVHAKRKSYKALFYVKSPHLLSLFLFENTCVLANGRAQYFLVSWLGKVKAMAGGACRQF